MADLDASDMAATLPRPLSLLRRRAGPPPLLLRLSMPIAAGAGDLVDFAAFAGAGAGAEDSMLQALLSSLPEPPASTATRPPWATPPASPTGLTASSGSLLKTINNDVWLTPVLPETPAQSRRNTDEVDAARLPPRRFRIDVHAPLRADRRPHVAVTELVGATWRPADPGGPAVQGVLRHHPHILALCKPSAKSGPPTRMRPPTRLHMRRGPPLAAVLSFTLGADDDSSADCAVRALDVAAMAAAYAPHVHALLAGPVLASPDAPAKPPEPPCRPQRRSDAGVGAPRADSVFGSLPAPRQLRASASVANLRAAFAEHQPRVGLSVTRRRSEVQALITQANAVLGGGGGGGGVARRCSAVEPAGARRCLRPPPPPRASLPLPLMGAPPPPPALAAALSRQLHRLGAARGLQRADESRIPLAPRSTPARHSGPALRSFRPDDDDCAGFLTLRPVHTPDLVPRTIDPRLVERAMTPMLKTASGLRFRSMADLPALAEVSPAAEAPRPSRLSPLHSPEPPEPPTRVGFLARYRNSVRPLPVSAIPLPPATPKPAPPQATLVAPVSKIPTLRKARSLWSLRTPAFS
ncbi:hypothetical protein GGI02_001558 [Coemansia sp. RSA 2322]|nr:hypothetical protein GGI02_001558 [Coemansia sp. RSA 2322]